MNRMVWKLVKLLTLLFILYLVSLQILQETVWAKKLPYEFQSNNKIKLKFTDQKFKPKSGTNDIDEPTVYQPDEVPDSRLKKETNPTAVAHGAPKSDNTLIDALLMKPAQSQNFVHKNDSELSVIWPGTDERPTATDRIIAQMKYIPPIKELTPKQILVYNGLRDGMRPGSASFKDQNCPVSACELTSSRAAATTADIILFRDHVSPPSVRRPSGQIWMLFLLESPYHTPSLMPMNHKINWTGTYRYDSTIVAPYERFTLFNSEVKTLPLVKNYAKGKTKKVAWFVSNCGARNNRLQYALELSQYIEVDIYGACGKLQCPRLNANRCFDLLNSDYKFYLAFENSNCRDYITEKFFINGLKNEVLPIVMGAHPDDYKRAAPINSYIHVDDFESPAKLAEYLHELDKDDEKYNEYFRWKGTGDVLNTYFWCRLCAMAHAVDYSPPPPAYAKLEEWWRGPSVCEERTKDYIWPKWTK